MATPNQTFLGDLHRFSQRTAERIEAVVVNAARETHKRLVEITPYRTGRARASWNITAGEPDGTPAPEFAGNTGINASEADIAAANAFFDPIIQSKSRFAAPKGTLTVSVANGVHYIEDLNAGRSRQAPAGFFQATVAGVDLIVAREVGKLGP